MGQGPSDPSQAPVAIDGNVRGAGKGLLADTIGIITTGKPLLAQAHVRDDAEIEKRITALALQGDGPQRIDNVRGGFGTRKVCRVAASDFTTLAASRSGIGG